MPAVTYEGPHLKRCECLPPLHYYLVDELDHRICPIPLLNQEMVREAIEKYGAEWNDTIRAHLEGNLASSNLPERLDGMEYQSLDDAIAQWERFRDELSKALMKPPIIFGIETDENGIPTGDGFIAIPLMAEDKESY